MAAFRQALADGADGIEFDVRLAADGVPVVIHDSSLRRVGMRNEPVSLLTSAELAETDVGTWFNRRFPALANQAYATERVPTLDQLFLFLKESDGLLYLEMKPGRGEAAALARAVVQAIDQHSLHDRTVVLSFDLDAVRAIKEIDRRCRTAALFQPRLLRTGSVIRKSRMVPAALSCEADEIALHHFLVTPRLVQQAHAAGLRIVVWTVDTLAWIESARRLGLHALITNAPRAMVTSRDP